MESQIANALIQQGVLGLIVFCAGLYYVKTMRPEQIQREKERDRLLSERQATTDLQHSDRMKDMIDLVRTRDKEWAEREMALRNEHAEAWEIHRKQAREDREADRALFREAIQSFAGVGEKLRGGQDRNFASIMGLAESLGKSKTHLIKKVEDFTQEPVDNKYKTQVPDQ